MLLGSLRCGGKPWTGRRSDPARCHRRPRSSEGSPPRRVAGPGGTGSAAARAPGGAGRPAHSRPAPPAGARLAARSSHILAGRRSQAAAGRRGPPGSRRRTNFAKFRRDTGRSACRAAPPSPAAARSYAGLIDFPSHRAVGIAPGLSQLRGRQEHGSCIPGRSQEQGNAGLGGERLFHMSSTLQESCCQIRWRLYFEEEQ
ncbi:collagen alpha-2(I) chain-like [Anomalospiza imberbis]|uniref:collagen alpha-2(I) chain-like n=1 Tax=Anomalospiza imberbis TaxID=187417 RepID=UPI0035900A44